MAIDIYVSQRPLFGPLSGHVFYKYWFQVLRVNKDVQLPSITDKLAFWALKFIVGTLMKYQFVFNWFNRKMKSNVDNAKKPEVRRSIANKFNENDNAVKYKFDDSVFN